LDLVISEALDERYAWIGWKKEIPLTQGKTEILVRATDADGNVQPPKSIWNERGLRVNHYAKTVITKEA
jgi:hypothetical protein